MARSIRAIDLHNGFLFGVQPILCFIFSYPAHPVLFVLVQLVAASLYQGLVQ